MKLLLVIISTLTLLATGAMAEIVTVEFFGSVEYNQINQGVFADVNGGDDVYATFTLDSTVWEDSPNGFGVRGYPIDQASFQLTIGSVGPVALLSPQPDGEITYFNLRNDDPVSDGLFVFNVVR